MEHSPTTMAAGAKNLYVVTAPELVLGPRVKDNTGFRLCNKYLLQATSTQIRFILQCVMDAGGLLLPAFCYTSGNQQQRYSDILQTTAPFSWAD